MKILIIDDEILIGESLKRILLLNNFYNITVCSDSVKAEEEIYKNIYDIVFIDIIMPKKNGDIILEEAKKKGIKSEFVILTALQDIPLVVKCIKLGAFDYLTKPLKEELILNTVKRIEEYLNLKNSIEIFTSSENISIPEPFKKFYTNDLNIKKIMNYIVKIALNNSNILITGESGTGKGIFAQVIHSLSRQKNNNFVSLNINAIPASLFESSLFGYKKGAFTDALTDTKGFLHKANNGTLFLDEIGDLDLNSQSKLLKVIEDKEFYPIGSNTLEKSNFRLITATNKNLLIETKSGRFREDLYYRINSCHIIIPPLRERGNDIIYIAQNLLRTMNEGNKTNIKFSLDSLYKLSAHSYPGNFRELQQIVETSYNNCTLNTGGTILPEHIIFDELIKSDAGNKTNYTNDSSDEHNSINLLTLDEDKKQHIKKILNLSKSKKLAAETLGISRAMLYKYIEKYGLK